jgi:hypothetical protein
MRRVRSLFAFAALWSLCGCAIKSSDIPGSYSSESNSKIVKVNTDGTFSTYLGSRKIYEGRWHLTDHQFGDHGIELDRKPGPGMDGSADDFELVRRHGQICWKANSMEPDYFCKAKP